MPKVTFRNIPDDLSEYKETDKEYLIPAVYEYARTCNNDELYNAIMKDKVVVYVNNEYISPDDWATYKIKQDARIIITPEISGDNAGAWIQIGIGVILMVVAWWNPAGLFGAGMLMEGMAGSVALMGGALALGGMSSLLFKPDLPSLDFRSSGKSQTYSWSG